MLLEKMYRLCADFFGLIIQIRSSAPQDLPPAETVQRRIQQIFDQMDQQAREWMIPDGDVLDAKYAFCAFADEVVLNSNWREGRTLWQQQPLQLLYFNSNTAGEDFFTKLEDLKRYPDRAHVLEVYYLCLALGFQGKYRFRGGEVQLLQVTEQTASEVLRQQGGAGELLAPHGERRDGGRGVVQRELPLVAISLGCLVVAILAVIGLKIAISSTAGSVSSDVTRDAIGISQGGGAASAPGFGH